MRATNDDDVAHQLRLTSRTARDHEVVQSVSIPVQSGVQRAAVVAEESNWSDRPRRTAEVPMDRLEPLLKQLPRLRVSGWSDGPMGLDGTTFGVSLTRGFMSWTVEWWQEGPQSWRPLVRWSNRLKIVLLDCLDAADPELAGWRAVSRRHRPRTLCPECGGLAIRVLYGMPTSDAEIAIQKQILASAGCTLPPDPADWTCTVCERTW